MNPKIFGAFLAGLVVASGITYYLVKPPEPAPVKTQQQAAAPAAPETVPPAPAEATTPAEPVADSSATVPEPAASKPSAVIKTTTTATASKVKVTPAPKQSTAPPSRRSEPAPVQTASNTPPTSTTAPTPASAPAPSASNHESTNGGSAAKESEPPPYVPPKIDVPPPPNKVTIPAGTLLTVRLSDTLSTERNQPGDQFTAVLDQPLVADGFVLAERGAKAQGRIVELDRGGKVQGVAQLAVELTQIRTSDGQNIKVNTAAFKRQAEAGRNKDLAKVGIGAAIGAAIGAIAGGGKGAAIGAGAGGAAGAGSVLLTRGKPAELAVETRLSFRLAEPVVVTERR